MNLDGPALCSWHQSRKQCSSCRGARILTCLSKGIHKHIDFEFFYILTMATPVDYVRSARGLTPSFFVFVKC